MANVRDVQAWRQAFNDWRLETAKRPDAEDAFEARFLELKAELEKQGAEVEFHQDYLTATHLLHNTPWRRTECTVKQGSLEFKAGDLAHSAKAKVSALFDAYCRLLAWQQGEMLGEDVEIPLS